MSEKKHIDRLFQEKLKDFEVTPNDAVWENINERLHEDKRKRRVIPLWWKLAGVAALVALLLTVGVQFLPNDSNSGVPNSVVDTEMQSLDKNDELETNSSNANDGLNTTDEASTLANEDTSVQDEKLRNPSTITSNGKQTNYNISDARQNRIVDNSDKNSKENNNSKLTNRNLNSVQNNKLGNSKDAVVAAENLNQKSSTDKDVNKEKKSSEVNKLIHDFTNDVNSAVTDNTSDKEKAKETSQEVNEIKETLTEEQTIEDAIAEANTEDEKEKKLNRWSISPNVAPVYFNSLGKGSTLDEQFVDNANSNEVTMSYGVGGSYAINEKLKVRAGINKVNMGYSTNNVIAFRNLETSVQFDNNGSSGSSARSHLSNVNVNSHSEDMVFLSTETLDKNRSPEIINSKSNGSINQRFGFIEVPLEMEYAVINNKFGVNVIGGFSTFMVDENEIYSVVNGSETNIGEANNINNMSFSANFGLGINYNISDHIKVNLEPTFKYQINTFNNTSGDFQPFFIGVYTGLSYKF